MEKKEAIKTLVSDYGQKSKVVESKWNKFFNSDIVQEMAKKGHDPATMAYRMVKADLASKYIGGPVEKVALHVLAKSDTFTNSSGDRQVNIIGIGAILKEKKLSFVTILNMREEPVEATEAVEVGKSYKGVFSVGTKKGNELTLYFADGRTSYEETQLKLSGEPLDILRKMFSPIKLNQLEDFIKEGKDYTTYAVEAQVVSTFTRPRKNGGQTGHYVVTDDSLTHKDEVAMGGGLSVLVSPNLLKYGTASTILILGTLNWYEFDDGSRRPSMMGNMVFPVIPLPRKVDKVPTPAPPAVADPDATAIKDVEGATWIT